MLDFGRNFSEASGKNVYGYHFVFVESEFFEGTVRLKDVFYKIEKRYHQKKRIQRINKKITLLQRLWLYSIHHFEIQIQIQNINISLVCMGRNHLKIGLE